VSRTSRIDWDAVPLGTKYDRELAEELGCTTSRVCQERNRRNIPPFDPHEEPMVVVTLRVSPDTAATIAAHLGPSWTERIAQALDRWAERIRDTQASP
jgi:hypothetical protein